MRNSKLIIAAVYIFLIGMNHTAFAESSASRLLRTSLVDGDVTYLRSDLDKWIELGINTPLFEGDKIWTGKESRAEIEFDDGSFLRLGENSILEIIQLGQFGQPREIELLLNRGLATLGVVEAEGFFIVDAPLYSIRVQQASRLRLEVDPDDSGRVSIMDGSAEIKSQPGQLTLAKGESIRFSSQDLDRYYLGLLPPRDEWDDWNDARDEYLARWKGSTPQSESLGWENVELNQYGNWEDLSGYGRVWRPQVDAGWSPFSDGHWVWFDTYGWTWVSLEPWGWLPYHYGRWAFADNLGWFWVPGLNNQLWCAGAVRWIEGSSWIGWVPMGPGDSWTDSPTDSWQHNRGVNYLSRSQFVTGQVSRASRMPVEYRKQARLLAGQPEIQPRIQSRMPVSPTGTNSRTFTNDDLEGRRQVRDSSTPSATARTQSLNGGTTEPGRQRSNPQVTSVGGSDAAARKNWGNSNVYIVGDGNSNRESGNRESISASPTAGSSRQGQRITRFDAATTPARSRQEWTDDYLHPANPVPTGQAPEFNSRGNSQPSSSGGNAAGSRGRWADSYPSTRPATLAPTSPSPSDNISRTRSASPPVPSPPVTIIVPPPNPSTSRNESSTGHSQSRSSATGGDNGRASSRNR